jgi:hypothetical protein
MAPGEGLIHIASRSAIHQQGIQHIFLPPASAPPAAAAAAAIAASAAAVTA